MSYMHGDDGAHIDMHTEKHCSLIIDDTWRFIGYFYENDGWFKNASL